MRVVAQTVDSCNVIFEGNVVRAISAGYVFYIGIERGDSMDQMLHNFETLFSKLKNVTDPENDILILSQFTLFADLKKNKPNFHHAENNSVAREMFYKFVDLLKGKYKNNIQTGIFGEYLNIQYAGKNLNTIYFDFNE